MKNRQTIILATLAGSAVLIGVASLRGADPSPTTPTTRPAAVTSAAPTRNTGQNDRNTNNNDNNRRSRRNRNGTTSIYGGPTTSPAYSSNVDVSDQIVALKTRSIFIKGNQTVTTNDTPRNTGNGGNGNSTGPMVGRPESSLVFNGVTLTDDETDALIEDISSHRVSMVRPGDAIAGGKITDITFDDLTYEVKGSKKHVEIGQNLDGVDAVFTDSSAPTISPPNSGTPGGSNNSGNNGGAAGAAPSSGIPSGASQEDILARMKAKRAKELSGN